MSAVIAEQETSAAQLAARCLVVDDDPQVRNAVARVVRSQGLDCVEAASALEALALLEKEGEVPLVISDIRMPEMDGVQFLEELLRRWPDTAVIMLTAVSEVPTAVACLEKGAHHCRRCTHTVFVVLRFLGYSDFHMLSMIRV